MSAAEQIFGAGGKRMRPALVFLVARATAEICDLKWGALFSFSVIILNCLLCWIGLLRICKTCLSLRELTREHRRLAEIIEMIHTASLIHDDVLDESDMRRGRPLSWLNWLSALKVGLRCKTLHHAGCGESRSRLFSERLFQRPLNSWPNGQLIKPRS